MKQILTLFLSTSLLFTGCFGGGEEATTNDSDQEFFFEYSTAEYSIDVPDQWESINAFTTEYPDNVRVAFRNNIQESDFVANVNVIREDTNTSTNGDFSQKKLSDHEDNLVNYQLIAQEEVTLNIGNNESATFLNQFSGKNSTSGTTLEFQQIYLVKGDKAWTVTASYLPGEDEFTIERMNTMLKSFSLK